MATRIAWVLNLDADLELGGGGAYASSKRVRIAARAHAAKLAASLLDPNDVLVDEESPEGAARGLIGRAFCPTPRALALLRRAGADPEPHPPVEVLRRVNSRAFASALGPTLPGATFVRDLDAARAILATEPAHGQRWRIKHPFGMAGRNQRVMTPARLDDREIAFLKIGIRQGGLQIEPDVAIEEEFAIHAFVERDRTTRTGPLVRQRCDARGAWIATERIVPPEPALDDVAARMAGEARDVAAALAGAGFFGPFGIDAYTYRDLAGQMHLQPRSEINARYSMGFAVGMPLEPEPRTTSER